MDINRNYDKSTISYVAVIGAIFGSFTGPMYFRGNLWIGLIFGIIGGIIVAKLYLCNLTKIFAKNHRWFKTWGLGSLAASLCGFLCNTFIHVMLLITRIITTDISLERLTSGFLLLIMFTGLIGAVVGLLIGTLATQMHIVKAKEKQQKQA